MVTAVAVRVECPECRQVREVQVPAQTYEQWMATALRTVSAEHGPVVAGFCRGCHEALTPREKTQCLR